MTTGSGLAGARQAEEPAPGIVAGTLQGTRVRQKAPAPSVKQAHKAQTAYRTISEVAAELDVATHVLRFWESKFPLVQPLKKSGGRRYYRPEDIALLRHIQDLLYRQGYTIKGVQTHLNKAKKRDLKQAVEKLLTPAGVLAEVRAIHDLLRGDLVKEARPQPKGV